MDTTVPKSPDIPEPEIGQRVRHASGWTGRVRAYSQADRAVQVQWDDPTCEPTADADGCSWHHANWLTAISEQEPTCTGCGRPIHRIHGMWLDDLDAGHCPSGAKRGLNGHKPPAAPLGVCDLVEVFGSPADGPAYYEVKCQHGVFYGVQPGFAEQISRRWHAERAAVPPPLAVYVVEDRDSAGVGPWHRHDQTAYPTADAAQAAVERDYGAVDWDDQLEARMPGTSTAWWRITELTLAGTGPTGGSR